MACVKSSKLMYTYASGVEAKIVHPSLRNTLDQGEHGEICIRGPNAALGYLADEVASKVRAYLSKTW